MASKKILAKNKKAFADYEVLDDYEAGIQLIGCEVKSCRASNVNLKGSYITLQGDEAYTKDIHIAHYKNDQSKKYDPIRPRKLLLHRKELDKIASKLNTHGLTVIPLELYLKRNLIKLRIGICRGKKKYDRREDLKRKDQNLQIKRALKRYG